MHKALAMVGPWLFGFVLFGFPVWLVWWLSDGFRDIRFCGEPVRYGHDEDGLYRPLQPYEHDFGPSFNPDERGNPNYFDGQSVPRMEHFT